MCGCSNGISSKASGRSSTCSGKVGTLQTVRNQLITLEKLVDGAKKEEYRAVRRDIEQLMKESVITCPETSVVNDLKNYIVNEYAIYNN